MKSVECKVSSVECRVESVKCGVWSVDCKVWSVEFAVSVSVCVYVCLCMGGRLQLVPRGYEEAWRSREAMGGYGRLRRGKTEESGGTVGKRQEKTTENDGNVKCN